MKLLNLKSRLRRKLLALYFTNPDEKYYVNQLARILDDSAGNIRNELMNLCKDGLFEREHLGNLVFYKLNKNFPLYAELESIVRKSIGAEGGLKESLQDVQGIICAFIFGSFARNEQHAGSDIDLFIIGSPDTDTLTDAIHKQEDILNRQINYHLYSQEEWDKKSEEEGTFILNLKTQPKIFLIGDASGLQTK
jgi:predicted nucleotidyltransferase